jgi:beta-lactamase regulating signal transducer with metallopeptidase domain
MAVLYFILKLSLGLIIIWLFYQLVLRRLTFYTWNRWYLVIAPALAFLLPLIDIAPVLEKNNWNKTPIVSAIPQIPAYQVSTAVVVPAKSFSEQMIGWLPFLIVAGAAIMLVRLLIQYFSLQAMRRSSVLLLNGRVKVYQVNKQVIPFSFGNSIFLNQHLHGEEELKEIIRHEFIHVKQRHTFDIIWGEAICILTWYNPFSWLLRKAIRQNLEFIADQQVLKTGVDRREYQYLLLKVIGVPSFSIASNFNFKSLKKRIAMMNKVKSARVHLVRFLLLLPVVAILLVAFRNAAKHRQLPPSTEKAVTDTIPGRKAFPENVRSFHNVDNRVTVTLKNGKEEKYDLNIDQELSAFEKKYGKMQPPPAPPVAPVAPVLEEVRFAAPVIVQTPAEPAEVELVEVVPPAPPQDDCYNSKGYCLSVINSPKGQLVMVAGKGKKDIQLITLEDWKKDKKYEEKFGKLPPAPPPPPIAPHAPVPAKHELPEGVSSVHVKDFDAVVKNTDGTVDRYDLRVSADKIKFDQRFSGKFHPEIVKVHGVPADGAKDAVMTDVAFTVADNVSHEILDAASSSNSQTNVTATTPGQTVNLVLADDADILAVITPNTTFKELERLKTDLKAKGITLTWINMKADDGKLTTVEGKLSAGTDKCHFNVDDFTRLILTRKKGDNGRRAFGVHSSSEKVTD